MYLRADQWDNGGWIQGTGYGILDTGGWILDTGYKMQDTGYWMQDTGYHNKILLLE